MNTCTSSRMRLICTTYFLFLFVCHISSESVEISADSLMPDNSSNDNLQFLRNLDSKVEIKLYYECMCPYSRDFLINEIKEIIDKLNEFVTIYLYPYGNAKTIKDKGRVKFVCQHGPKECYGNKLHACTIDTLLNKTKAILYDTCMVDYVHSGKGSDDNAADECAEEMNVDSETIKDCANSAVGVKLLEYYGEESKKANFKHVPYVLINEKLNNRKHFFQDVCAVLHNRPKHCDKYNSNNKV